MIISAFVSLAIQTKLQQTCIPILYSPNILVDKNKFNRRDLQVPVDTTGFKIPVVLIYFIVDSCENEDRKPQVSYIHGPKWWKLQVRWFDICLIIWICRGRMIIAYTLVWLGGKHSWYTLHCIKRTGPTQASQIKRCEYLQSLNVVLYY